MKKKLLFLSGIFLVMTCLTFLQFFMSPSSHKKDMGLGYQDDTGKAKPKIVGGVEAKNTDWPWVAGILYAGVGSNYSAQFCGSSVIHQKWVVTAAHCVDRKYGSRNLEPGDIQVLVGAHDLSKEEGRRIGVKRIIVHPNYDSARYINDIALLELEESAGVESLPLYESINDLAGENAVAIGWGSMSSDRNRPVYPVARQQVTLPIADQWQCTVAYGSLVGDSMICAGVPAGGKDACQGDSGGPLVVQDGAGWVLAGITSWGVGCAQPGKYGVYSRVSSFMEFVREYVPENSDCTIVQKSFRVEAESIPEVGVPVKFDVQAYSGCGEKLYYHYSYAPDYGTTSYDPANGWVQVLGGDGFSESGSVSVSFPSRGYYVFVAKINPVRAESESLTLAGCTVAVKNRGVYDQNCMIMPVSISSDFQDSPLKGSPVTFSVDSISECPGQIYYYYVYAPDYGSGSIHDVQGWQKMLPGDGFSINKTVTHVFTQEGNYVVLGLMSHTRNRPDAIATIGMTVAVKAE